MFANRSSEKKRSHGVDLRVALVAALLLTPKLAFGQMSNGPLASHRKTSVVTLGERYKAGSLHGAVFGKGYRKLWATPIKVEYLDLSTFAGGLTAVRRGGSGQTKSLHLDGADGRRYIVRSVDKTLHVPEDFQDTFVKDIMQDMKIPAFHPGAALVVPPLAEAVGVLHVTPRLVIIPDDPRLGEFREEFAGLVGFIEERPNEGPGDTPGFAGSEKIVATEKLFQRLEESPRYRVDTRDFLRARLLDIWLGDRDRHYGQWRWASFPEGENIVWRTIPRDRDEAFVRNDGIAWRVVQRYLPRMATFKNHYRNIGGLTENGWDLDRILLGDLEWPVWDSLATAMQGLLTDSVIAAAVHQMPPEMYELSGAKLDKALRSRRDDLRKAARFYYSLISEEVDVYATDWPELVNVNYAYDGKVTITIQAIDKKSGALDDAPYFVRRFDPEETKEVRLYLRGGNDTIHETGSAEKKILVRAIGGGGENSVEDVSRGGGRDLQFYRGKYKRPKPPGIGPHEYYLDWGHSTVPAPIIRANLENGLILGDGFVRHDYAFHKAPYSHKLLVQGALATSGRAMFEFESKFIQVASHTDLSLHTWVSGVEPTNFYGFGNNTANPSSTTYNKVDKYQFLVDPALILSPFHEMKIEVGPVFKYVVTSDQPGRFVTDSLYGAGNFGQIGAQLSLELDARGQFADFPRDYISHTRFASGLNVKARVSAYPAALDVNDPFGEISGEITPYVSVQIPTEPTLALRLGGKKVWGENEIPFGEAAYIGGGSTLRGFSSLRFAGDAAVYGNANLRFSLANFYFLFPTEFGILGLADAGRVWVDRDSPGGWHKAVGGGLWFAPMRRAYTISLTMASSTEGKRIYLSGGFLF